MGPYEKSSDFLNWEANTVLKIPDFDVDYLTFVSIHVVWNEIYTT